MDSSKHDYMQHRPHPWHGIRAIVKEPDIVHAFIEVTRFDTIKFEVDPESGYLSVDRPQRNSSLPPIPYGFVPQTLCADRAGECMKPGTTGDGDALDICVLCEQDITRSEVVLGARIVGGLRTMDNDRADPKLMAVLDGDLLWGDIREMEDVPDRQLERVEHYFRQYKVEKNQKNPVTLLDRMNREEALELLSATQEDYRQEFG